MDELNALPYLDAVVREILRLHPGRGIDRVGRVLVKVIDEVYADVALGNVTKGKFNSSVYSHTSSPLDHIYCLDAPIGRWDPTLP